LAVCSNIFLGGGKWEGNELKSTWHWSAIFI